MDQLVYAARKCESQLDTVLAKQLQLESQLESEFQSGSVQFIGSIIPLSLH